MQKLINISGLFQMLDLKSDLLLYLIFTLRSKRFLDALLG